MRQLHFEIINTDSSQHGETTTIRTKELKEWNGTVIVNHYHKGKQNGGR